MNRSNITWKQLGIMIGLVTSVWVVVMAHFNGVNSAVKQSNEYTDTRIIDLKERIDKMEDRILKEIRLNK